MQPLFKAIEKRGPLPKPDKKKWGTERGELMRYFLDRLNPSRVQAGIPPLTMGRMGKLLEAIPTKDLYALKSQCEDTERCGYSFSKRFWWEVKPKEQLEARESRKKHSGK